MNAIAIFSWALILLAAFSLIHAWWKIRRGARKPVRIGMEAIITVLAFGFFITVWNTDIPVWIWWVLVAGAGLLAATTVTGAARVREEERR